MSICLSVYLSLSLYIYISVYLSIHPYVYLSIYLSIFLSICSFIFLFTTFSFPLQLSPRDYSNIPIFQYSNIPNIQNVPFFNHALNHPALCTYADGIPKTHTHYILLVELCVTIVCNAVWVALVCYFYEFKKALVVGTAGGRLLFLDTYRKCACLRILNVRLPTQTQTQAQAQTQEQEQEQEQTQERQHSFSDQHTARPRPSSNSSSSNSSNSNSNNRSGDLQVTKVQYHGASQLLFCLCALRFSPTPCSTNCH
jgi:hypothetical protein